MFRTFPLTIIGSLSL